MKIKKLTGYRNVKGLLYCSKRYSFAGLLETQQQCMKKLMICILCLVSISGFAQFRLGVQGSLSALTYWQTDGYGGLPSQEFTWAKNGYQAGIFAEYDLGYSGITIQPALMYAVTGAHISQTLGFNDNANFTYVISDSRITVNVLRLPVNILYTYRIDPKFQGLRRFWTLCRKKPERNGKRKFHRRFRQRQQQLPHCQTLQ